MKTKLSFVALFVAMFGFSSAQATTYNVNEAGFQSQECFPNCSATASLTGTITTNGTIGTELSPSIITSWNLSIDVGTQHLILTNANSHLAYNDSGLLTTTTSVLYFDFSARHLAGDGSSNQYYLNFDSSLGIVNLFSATYGPSSFGPQFEPGGIGIEQYTPDQPYALNVKYFPEGTQLVEIGAATPLPAALPLFASAIGTFGLLGWRKKRKQAALAA